MKVSDKIRRTRLPRILLLSALFLDIGVSVAVLADEPTDFSIAYGAVYMRSDTFSSTTSTELDVDERNERITIQNSSHTITVATRLNYALAGTQIIEYETATAIKHSQTYWLLTDLAELFGGAPNIPPLETLQELTADIDHLGLLDDGTAAHEEVKGLRVVIDPGHGGEDSGAVGPTGLVEKELVFDIASRVATALTSAVNIDVQMTRMKDVAISLRDRITSANFADADLFVSIHANSAPRVGAAGVEIYILGDVASDREARRVAAFENAVEKDASDAHDNALVSIFADMAQGEQILASKEFASLLHNTVTTHLKVEARGVRQAPFFVLVGATMPAVLLETGFVTNPDEASRLKTAEYRQQYATAIARAIIDFLPVLAARKGEGVETSNSELPLPKP